MRRHCAFAAALVLVVGATVITAPAATATQDDARSGADAGGTFESATPVHPYGPYSGRLDRAGGDRHDYFKFFVAKGGSLSAWVLTSSLLAEPVELLDPAGRPVDVGLLGGVSTRVAIRHALVGGEYRLHLRSEQFNVGTYEICFMNCEAPQEAPIEFIFGGSLPSPNTQVLLVPPQHGDLGNPDGPSVFEYIDATLRGMHRWTDALDAFAADHPEYAYLSEIEVEIEIFDGVTPVEPAGYDVIIGYVASGPAFRGVASDPDQSRLEEASTLGGLVRHARFGGRFIALSLFASSPRVGQTVEDFPELADLETVTMHEFAHTFGLGHTMYWHPEHGPDLMNSPATFVYGDGSPAGDGGERTPVACISSLDLYGMAHLYRWIPKGKRSASIGSTWLPDHVPYRLYC